MQSNRQVVVTGFGALTPVGNDRESTWQALLAGKSGIAPITAFDATGLPTTIAGEVKGFDPSALLDRKRERRSARFSQLAVAAAREAVADASLTVGGEGVDAGRVGVVLNNAVAGMDGIERAVDQMHADPRTISPYFVSSVIPNMPACEVAIDLGVRGPVTASALACASGVYALLEARRLILSGEADVVLAGGTDSAITRVMFQGLSNMGALSKRNDEPERASRPFDADRDGFVFGEGAVVCVLESAEHAAARGARAYAEVAGGALTSDAFHVSAPDPSGAGAVSAMRQALERTGTAASDVDYICAHGTSTRINDLTESKAIREVYGNSAYDLLVSSPKSMVGHLIGAAGALSAMVAALAIRDGVVPPTINLDQPGEECDLDYVPHTARKADVRAAAVNAFGFGGQNCVAVLRAV
ncbi:MULTISPECIES: beta-ketoacyl-ACP synthase II [unclassified Streptomyces]|uniref:3-oxoacyl-[acyl-carrier-protein] synthase 2 n=1 Tax=Streptomyces evansiae TaxID=3075535 RepID=A0ABU2QUK8_9ACTN|nr:MULTISPECIES: beta-ketoacyl-ACP synthase II [unclassified Streptomyces]EFK98866.1 3-oxoacyl-[acyl-carrier-protein] synthase 2 [Streptomyces sp. SPB78]MDT0408040.1 beta-ketoacyl-ACP synthase II [Streptomyces sp. DSM 41979]WEH26589.1 beta-ketoacyl-ACP synthase II [Streptomyces sp. AM 3-1-1]SCD96485.1 3-oxoacyl-[acyl-carrier-protein] synthase II [Streptomyces sp. TverLS-915]SCE51323.1 3-oxoacyl-[acyl-carrier-protein] synthase II [Streptomyces sp. DfronAA-171]